MTIKLCLFRRINENKKRNTPLNPLLIEGKIADNPALTGETVMGKTGSM